MTYMIWKWENFSNHKTKSQIYIAEIINGNKYRGQADNINEQLSD